MMIEHVTKTHTCMHAYTLTQVSVKKNLSDWKECAPGNESKRYTHTHTHTQRALIIIYVLPSELCVHMYVSLMYVQIVLLFFLPAHTHTHTHTHRKWEDQLMQEKTRLVKQAQAVKGTNKTLVNQVCVHIYMIVIYDYCYYMYYLFIMYVCLCAHTFHL